MVANTQCPRSTVPTLQEVCNVTSSHLTMEGMRREIGNNLGVFIMPHFRVKAENFNYVQKFVGGSGTQCAYAESSVYHCF